VEAASILWLKRSQGDNKVNKFHSLMVK
jgi:hypothetical protein